MGNNIEPIIREGRQVVDTIVIPADDGSRAEYDIALPENANQKINNLTLTGDLAVAGSAAVVGGLVAGAITEGSELLEDKYQAKQTNPIEGVGATPLSSGKRIAVWRDAGYLEAGTESIESIITKAKEQTTSYVTNITNMSSLATENLTVIVNSFVNNAGQTVPLSNFHVGDVVYLIETNYPDRWVSSASSSELTLSALDAKTDLRDYSLKTHEHNFTATGQNISVSTTINNLKTTGVSISEESVSQGEIANYTPAGVVEISQVTNTVLETSSITPFGSAGTLPELTTNILTFNGGTVPQREQLQFNTNGIKAVSSSFTGTEGAVTTSASGNATYTPSGTIGTVGYESLEVKLGSNTTQESGVKYLEDITYTEASVSETAAVVRNISGGSGSMYATRTTSGSGSTARRTLTFTHTHTGAAITETANAATAISGGSVTQNNKYFHPYLDGTITSPTFTGDAVRLVTTPSGTIGNTTTPADNGNVWSITNVGSIASLKNSSQDVVEFKSVNSFTKGTLPSAGAQVTVATGNVTTEPSYEAEFTGTGVKLETSISYENVTINSSGINTISGRTDSDEDSRTNNN